MGSNCERTVVCGENKGWTSCAITDYKNCWSLQVLKGHTYSPLEQGNRMCRSLLSGISFFIELYGLFVYVFLTYSQLVDRKLESLASHTLIRLLLLLDLMLRMYKLFWSPTQRRLFMLMGISWNQPLHIIARFQTLFLLILLYLLLLLLIAILAIFFFPESC
jgi:hypothetical protein